LDRFMSIEKPHLLNGQNAMYENKPLATDRDIVNANRSTRHSYKT
jgi:hypothetical protein